MPDFKPRCPVEKMVASVLAKRAWTIRQATRRGADLDLAVDHAGQAGRVLFRSDFVAPKGPAGVNPFFVRIDLGEPEGPPQRWALWDQYTFSSSKYGPPRVATVVHEAMGDTWASLAGNAVAPGPKTWMEGELTFETLFEHAEALSPARGNAGRHAHIFALARHNFGRQHKPMNWIVVIGLLANFVVVPLIYVGGNGGVMAALGAAPYLFGFVALIFGIIGLVALVRYAKRPKSVEGMQAVVQSLRATGAFDAITMTRAKVREGLPVVRRQPGHVEGRLAPLVVGRLTASSKKHAVTLEADLCRVNWPEGTEEACRFLPDRWLVVDVSGPEDALAGLPAGVRADRYEGIVRWVFTGEEMDAGRAAELFQSAWGDRMPAPSPYRG